MRQALKSCARYPLTAARAIAADWNAFWYTPADPTLLGVMRVFTGLMLLYTHAVWGLALDDFFGETSWLSPSLVHAIEAQSYSYSFWFWVPRGAMWPVYALTMVVFAMFTAGLWTRITSLLALYIAISYAYRTPHALFGLDQINIMLTLYLAIAPSGQTLSLDRWLKVRRLGADAPPPAPSINANLAQRLIQVHMCVIYFFAGIAKLQGSSWWNGEAMWRAFANLEYQSLDMTWLAWHPWLINLMSLVSITWEISFCVMIWKPLWRPVMLIGAVGLHVGIGLCLGMWTFGLIMLVGCMSFLPNEGIRDLVATFSQRRERTAFALGRPSGESLATAARLRRSAARTDGRGVNARARS